MRQTGLGIARTQRTGNPSRPPAQHCRVERQRVARGIEEHGGRCLRRRDFAAVVDDDLARPSVIVSHEGAAAHARALRLDQRKHRLHRDRCVDRAPAALQYVEARLRRERIGGDDKRLRCRRSRNRSRRRCWRRRAGDEGCTGESSEKSLKREHHWAA